MFQKFVEFKQLCEYPIMLSVMLNFKSDSEVPEKQIMRFFGERVFALEFQMSCFVTNAKGAPVLSKQLSRIAREFMKNQVRIVLAPRQPNENLEKHYNYITYLFATHDNLDEENRQEVCYRNYLQSPLQPLADNLESTTYETFENDSIKYELYEKACFAAL